MSGQNKYRIPNGRKPRSPRENAANMRAMVILFAVLAVSAAALSFIAFSDTNANSASAENSAPYYTAANDLDIMQAALDTQSLFGNIFINGIDVGGMSRDEALEYLAEELAILFKDKVVTVSCEGETFTYAFDDFNVGFELEAAVDKAFNYARDGDFDQFAELILNPYEITAEYTFDINAVKQAVISIADTVDVPAADARLDFTDDGQFVITPEIIGKRLDVPGMSLLITDILMSMDSGLVQAVMIENMPLYTQAHILNDNALTPQDGESGQAHDSSDPAPLEPTAPLSVTRQRPQEVNVPEEEPQEMYAMPSDLDIFIVPADDQEAVDLNNMSQGFDLRYE